MKILTGTIGHRASAMTWTNCDLIDAHDATHLRWVYRQLRREGVRPSMARMLMGSAYSVGLRSEIRRPR